MLYVKFSIVRQIFKQKSENHDEIQDSRVNRMNEILERNMDFAESETYMNGMLNVKKSKKFRK